MDGADAARKRALPETEGRADAAEPLSEPPEADGRADSAQRVRADSARTRAPDGGGIVGRVVELRRDQYKVMTELGEVPATLKGAFVYGFAAREDYPCVGDFVTLQYNESGASQIEKLLPRRSLFIRADFSGHAAGYVKTVLEQMIAANFDYVFIMTSLNADFNIGRLRRYLAQAEQSGAESVILLTKADMVENFDRQLSEIRNAAPGVPVHAVSAVSGYGLDALNEYLKPEMTAVFLGMSGVGKSSLLNALMEREVMVVKAIRESDDRGRHTTTHRQLFMLPSGAMVIDTPGMREMGLIGNDDGSGAGYDGVSSLLGRCRFNDCRHISEPGCAILAALNDGSLPRDQWELYLAQKKEYRFADNRSVYLNTKRARNKSIATMNRQKKKQGRRGRP